MHKLSSSTMALGFVSAATNGSSFSVGCSTCGTAVGTILTITTTDGSVAGLSPTQMPLPVNRRVIIRCAEVGATSISVPANVSAYLMTAGATRIQATYVRSTFGSPIPANANLVNALSGHGVVGYTTP